MNSQNALLAPSPLGLKKSFGFGDRLGLATPGHLASCRKFGFAPIFAQQSIREMERTQRTPEEVMSAARAALAHADFSGKWGADADHLKTPRDVDITAAAGFCFFTIDPSAFVNNDADAMSENALAQELEKMISDGVLQDDWDRHYRDATYEVALGLVLRFPAEELQRAAVKYGRAIAHSADMARHIAQVCTARDGNARAFEIEVSVDETDTPTSALEHLFFGLELKRRGVRVVSLAPRFIGEMEKGIDYRGDFHAFERALDAHVAVARYCGPYKISVHSGSDKFSIYPIVGRVCGELLHVKTAGTSYLEALRVLARTDLQLLKNIAEFCHARFETDRQSYHISTTQNEVETLGTQNLGDDAAAWERAYLDERIGRQLLHVTFGSVLTQDGGQKFKAPLLERLTREDDLHAQLLEAHFDKHLSLLSAG